MSACTFSRVRVALPVCLAVACVACPAFAADGPIRRLSFDAEAPVVELFSAAREGRLAVRLTPRDEFESRVFITNETEGPLTVAVPQAVAAVQVLHQINFPPGGVFAPGAYGPGTYGTSAYGQGLLGPGQAVGGPLQSAYGSYPQTGLNSLPFPGSNFFSVPPQKTVELRLRTVCLEHGKKSPVPRMTYALRRLEDQLPDEEAQELIRRFDPEKSDRLAVQAAAWHLAGGMSWQELKEKTVVRSNVTRRYFAARRIDQAQALVERVREELAERRDGGAQPVAREVRKEPVRAARRE